MALDTTLDDALLREGIAREIVRTVQDGRKQAGLEVSDRIRLHIDGSSLVSEALNEHREWIMNETLTAEWSSTAFDTGFPLSVSLTITSGRSRWKRPSVTDIKWLGAA